MLEGVVSQYETALAELGFDVGLVLPASLSVLQLLSPIAANELTPGADYFFVNVESQYFSVTLVRNSETPTLYRTLGLRTSATPERYSEDDLLQEIIPTAIYYREKLRGETLERVYYRSLRPDFTHLKEVLEEQFEVSSQPFDLKAAVSLAQDLQMDAVLADAVGAAAGAALGRAA